MASASLRGWRSLYAILVSEVDVLVLRMLNEFIIGGGKEMHGECMCSESAVYRKLSDSESDMHSCDVDSSSLSISLFWDSSP